MHFEESTKKFQGGIAISARIPSTIQYINLLKCCWIVQRIRGSNNLRTVPDNSIWPEFVKQMIQSVKEECFRFFRGTRDKLIPPDVDSTLALDDSYFRIWPDQVEVQPFPLRNTYQAAVLSLPLESTTSLRNPDLTFYGIGEAGERSDVNATDYCLVEKGEDISGGRSRGKKSIKIDLNLTTIKVELCYAWPSSKLQEYALLIHAGSSEVKPTLTSLKDIFRVQHLLTGYRPYANYFQHHMQASFVEHGSIVPWEFATIQLWLPERYDEVHTSPGTSPLSSIPSTASSSRSPPPRSSRDRRFSSSSFQLGLNATTTERNGRNNPYQSTPLGSNRPSFLGSGPTLTPSVRRNSTFSLRRKPSSVTSSQSVSTITATTNGVTRQVPYHTPPENPMLVTALRSPREIRSLVAIEIDHQTDIKRTGWDDDLKAHIDRRDSSLLMRKWTDQFNIAKLGIDQKYHPQNVGKQPGVKRLSLKFHSVEGKECRWITHLT